MTDEQVMKRPELIFKNSCEPRVLMIELFYGGSHKELIDNIRKSLKAYTLVTLPSKKWHWRSRCGALCLLNIIPKITTEKVLFCSSVLNLAELLGMRPDLIKLKKIIYFHENQLMYPVQEIKERDIQYSYNQITSCVAADVVLFNSHFNRDTFLNNVKKIIKLIPDYRPKNLEFILREKSMVLYFPVSFPENIPYKKSFDECDILKIVWPHRWEFDKGPDEFFDILFRLKSDGLRFKLSILGEHYDAIPKIISTAREVLKEEIFHCGYMELKENYFRNLNLCHVAVSTSKHEFFGVAMLEATFCGCFPLVPNNLVYPEIYPENCLYSDLENLYTRLKFYCLTPQLAVEDRKNLNLDLRLYSAEKLVPQFLEILTCEDSVQSAGDFG